MTVINFDENFDDMKKIVFLLFLGVSKCAISQTVALNEESKNPATATVSIMPKEQKIELKNGSERKVLFYAGQKAEIFSGKRQSISGVSTNQLYLVSGDIFCILKDDKTTQSCTAIKPETTKIEINSSGNGFVK